MTITLDGQEQPCAEAGVWVRNGEIYRPIFEAKLAGQERAFVLVVPLSGRGAPFVAGDRQLVLELDGPGE